MGKVFLLFYTPDRERVLRLLRSFVGAGIHVFPEENPRWKGSIRRNVSHSFAEYEVVIIVWSKSSAPDMNMRYLASDALDQEKLIIVLFHKSDPGLHVVTHRTKNRVWRSLGLNVGSSPVYNLALWRGSDNNPELRRLVADLKNRICPK